MVGSTKLQRARTFVLAATALVAACGGGSGGRGAPTGSPPTGASPPPALPTLSIPDPVLRQCVLSAFSNAIDRTALTCAGVSDLAGLDVFPGLRYLEVRDGSFQSLAPLAGMASLERLDLRGVHTLHCEDIDSLIAVRPAANVLTEDNCRAAVVFDFGAREAPLDTVVDTTHGLVYVAAGDLVALPLRDIALAEHIPVPGAAREIELSIDGTRLFVVLDDGPTLWTTSNGSIAAVDLATRSVRTIAPTYWQGAVIGDVVEAQPGRLFVTASTRTGGNFARTFVAQVRLDQNDAVSIVTDLAETGDGPGRLLVSPTRDFVYAGDDAGLLYKLSLADPNAGAALQRQTGARGLENAVLNTSGTLLVTGGGQVLRTSSLEEHGRLTLPLPAYNVLPLGLNASAQASNGLWAPRSTRLFGGGTTQWETTEPIDFYSLDTLAQTRSIETRCGFVGSIRPYNADRDFVLAGKALPGYVTKVCIAASFPRSMPRERLGLFADPALQDCITAEARRRGFTRGEQFVTLDCSDIAEPIRTLSGIERLTNLEHLDISGSAPLGHWSAPLDFLPQLEHLRSFTAVGSGLRNITTLFDLPLLTTATLDGNPDISCTQLDELAAKRIGVSADYCTDRRRLPGDFDLVLSHDRTRAYVAAGNGINEVDLATFSIARTLPLPAMDARGIELSADGDTLFVAVGIGVVYIDLATGQLEIVDLRNELGFRPAYDVIETVSDRVLVSAWGDRTTGGFIALVQRDLGNAKSRVANGTFFLGSPRFAAGGDRSSVFMVAGGSTSRIYRLDTTQANVPIAAERAGADIFLQRLSAAPDGSRIYFNGAIIDAATLATLGSLPGPMVVPSTDGARLFVVDGNVPVNTFDPLLEKAGIYDSATLARTGERSWGCDMDFLPDALEEAQGWLLALKGPDLCAGRVVPY